VLWRLLRPWAACREHLKTHMHSMQRTLTQLSPPHVVPSGTAHLPPRISKGLRVDGEVIRS
jgi:hypothetical protein